MSTEGSSSASCQTNSGGIFSSEFPEVHLRDRTCPACRLEMTCGGFWHIFFSMNTCFGDVCALSETFKDLHQSHISAVLQVELTEGAGQLKYCFQLEAVSWRSLEGLRIRPKDYILFKTNMLTETTWPLRAKVVALPVTGPWLLERKNSTPIPQVNSSARNLQCYFAQCPLDVRTRMHVNEIKHHKSHLFKWKNTTRCFPNPTSNVTLATDSAHPF